MGLSRGLLAIFIAIFIGDFHWAFFSTGLPTLSWEGFLFPLSVTTSILPSKSLSSSDHSVTYPGIAVYCGRLFRVMPVIMRLFGSHCVSQRRSIRPSKDRKSVV